MTIYCTTIDYIIPITYMTYNFKMYRFINTMNNYDNYDFLHKLKFFFYLLQMYFMNRKLNT